MKIYGYLVFLVFFAPFIVSAQLPDCIGGPNCPAGSPDLRMGPPDLRMGPPDLRNQQSEGSPDLRMGPPDLRMGPPDLRNQQLEGSPDQGDQNAALTVSSAAASCVGDAAMAEGRCNAFRNTQMFGMVTSMMSGAGNSSKKQCEIAQALNVAGMATNLTFSQRCSSGVSQCITSCEAAIAAIQPTAANNPAAQASLGKMTALKGKCEGLKIPSWMAAMTVMQNMGTILASRDCIEQFEATERCDSMEKIKNDEFCKMQHCNRLSLNARLYDPICKDGVPDVDCSINHNFGKLVCVCKRNPQDPACSNPNPNLNPSPNNPYDPIVTPEGLYGDDPFKSR